MHNTAAATEPTIAIDERVRLRDSTARVSATTASRGVTGDINGGVRISSRQTASSWASSASLGSVEYTGCWLASASRNRSVRLISLSDGSPPLEVQRPKSGMAVLRRGD